MINYIWVLNESFFFWSLGEFYFSLVYLIFIVIQLQLYAFSPHPSTPPQPNPPASPTTTLPLDFVHVSFIVAPVILLVGMQTGEAALENSMEFPQNTKNGTALWPSNSTAGIIP